MNFQHVVSAVVCRSATALRWGHTEIESPLSLILHEQRVSPVGLYGLPTSPSLCNCHFAKMGELSLGSPRMLSSLS